MTSLITLSVSVCGHQGESDWQEMDGDDNAEAFHAARWCDTLSRLSVYGLVDHLQLRNNQIHSSLLIGRILVTLALQGDRWGLCIWKGCYEILSTVFTVVVAKLGGWRTGILWRSPTLTLRVWSQQHFSPGPWRIPSNTTHNSRFPHVFPHKSQYSIIPFGFDHRRG